MRLLAQSRKSWPISARKRSLSTGEQVYQEVSQELMQAGSEAIAEWKAGVNPPPGKRGIVDRVWDTAKQMVMSGPFMMLPKAVVDVARIATTSGEAPVAPESCRLKRRLPCLRKLQCRESCPRLLCLPWCRVLSLG